MSLFCSGKYVSIIKRNNLWKSNRDFCLKCLHLLKTKKNPCVKIKTFCGVVMLFEDTKILEFNQYQNSNKTACVIYADLESLIKLKNR